MQNYLSGRFSLKRLQWPNMNTTNIEMHNFEINWKVPSHSKVINTFGQMT
jgi:hypothetical protein